MGVGVLEEVKKDQNLTKSHFEKFVIDTLKREGIDGLYEPTQFTIYINGEEKRVYTPDVVTGLFVDSKIVVLEVHSFVDIEVASKEKNEHKKKSKLEKAAHFIEKIGKFRETYGIYMVIISSMPESNVEKVLGLNVYDFVDEYWFLKHNKIPDEGGNHYNAEKLLNHLEKLKEKGEVKSKDDLLYTLLAKLKEKDEVKNEEELLNIFNSKFIENVNGVEEKKRKSALKEAHRNSEEEFAFKEVSIKDL